jgi:serine/threonine protein kinase/formylglycine-generating enzyme required for sulfatase activity
MPSRSLPLSVLQQIDRLCDSFEAAWQGGLRPQIEEYLERTSISDPTELFKELLAREVELRKKAGDLPEPGDYLGRFGSYGDQVITVFNDPRREGETAVLPLSITEAGSLAKSGVDAATTVPNTTETGRRTWDPNRARRSAPVVVPEWIGRFRVLRLLGQGNFLVFLARDEERGRDVAIKVARPDDAYSRKRLMSLAEEFHRLNNLDHPGIVKVYGFVPPADQGDSEEAADSGFIVLEWIDGPTLEQLFRTDRPGPKDLAEILARVADAVHHAHLAGLIHRDLKPSNILLDARSVPKVCDFGLAVDEEVQRLRRGEVAGTLPYMAPEQVRGETNRLDGRTDIWALGVILYRGLTGRLPFRGRTTAEYFDEILSREPRPPRQCARGIPRELERICLRCLSRAPNERYLTAEDLAEDLGRWLSGAAAEGRAPTVSTPARPKGLRAFGAGDAGSFLSLLPGPRDRDGIPESVRFWKTRIEDHEREREGAFCVGVIYGPSGGGKSSFVKAGLLPQLDRDVVRGLYVETTPQGTESRLLAELRRQVPALPHEGDLADAVAMLRDDRRLRMPEKILLVFDQFEQWLQSRPVTADAELVRALRHCDGKHVAALLLVRDDFWMATTRLFQAVEVRLEEGSNATAVELLDAQHTRKALVEFGRSLGRIEADGPPTPQVEAFLDQAVRDLADPDGRVIPVRLSLFVEVVRQRPWTIETLHALGGARGINRRFLEEAFESPRAPQRRQFHRKAAEAVLGTMLPAPTSQIRGAPRSSRSLLEVSGYANRPADFANLIEMLDRDLRLITAIDPERLTVFESGETQVPSNPLAEAHYQLAHDYLIPPVRQWLERKEQATPAGRGRLRLRLITAEWLERPGPHSLPSLLELAGIVWHTPARDWSGDERQMLRAAARHYLLLAFAAAVLIGAFGLGMRVFLDRNHAEWKLHSAIIADEQSLPGLLAELDAHRDYVTRRLERTADQMKDGPEKDRAILILYRYEPTRERGAILRRALLEADADEHGVIRQALADRPECAGIRELWDVVRDQGESPERRLRAAAALALLDEKGPGWRTAGPAIARALLDEDRRSMSIWVDLLDPVMPDLSPTIAGAIGDEKLFASTREAAAATLARALAHRKDDAGFALPLADAPPSAFRILIRALLRLDCRDQALEALRAILDHPRDASAPPVERGKLASRRANAAISIMILGQPESLWPLLGHDEDPLVRSLLIDRMARLGVDARGLVERLGEPGLDPIELQAILMFLAELRELAEPGLTLAPIPHAESFLGIVQAIYREHPHPGVRSAAGLVLRRWGRADLVSEADRGLEPAIGPTAGRRWFLGPNGHTFAVVGPLEGWVGSPPEEDGRFENEDRRYLRTGRTLAAAVTEVTRAQLLAFLKEAPDPKKAAEDGDSPAGNVNWYLAARYCNWLSGKAGLPRDEWCYPEPVESGIKLDAGAVNRGGFRLPTEVEWELLCRAGSIGSRPCGDSLELLPRYANTWLNTGEEPLPVDRLLPNENGLFDILGNLWEWCHDGPASEHRYPDRPPGSSQHPADELLRSEIVGDPETTEGRDPQSFRFMRGGAYDYSPKIWARSAARYHGRIQKGQSEKYKGFRVVRSIGKM